MALAATRSDFGILNGEPVELIALSNGRMEAVILTLGAAIHAVRVPDRDGTLADVALGHATLREYVDQPQFMGSTVGRVANRIAGGRFALDGREYRVPVNNGANSLHGGDQGFDKVNWRLVALGEGSVTLEYVSRDGDQGYPGTLTATAHYALDDLDRLSVEYRAETDAPTLVALSNHAYWNLAGEGADRSALDQLLTIAAEAYLPTDATAIPTGEFRPVAGSPFDFRQPVRIAARVRDAGDEQLRIGRGYDHNWVIAREVAERPRLVARLEDPVSGRVMEVHSDQPGLQFYSGNFFDATSVGKSRAIYRMGDAVALEPQQFPDTPNRPEFGSMRLAPGERYRNRIAWHFATTPAGDTRPDGERSG
ncbi:MAG: galactose mutarotase [Sphingomonadales bacterium]|nr:MAG: galactose mutarotase [Sphingomonadales bacterium]